MLQQLVFGAGSFVSPFVYSYLVSNLQQREVSQDSIIRLMTHLTPGNLPWVSIYWVFAFISFLMLVIILATRFPKVIRTEDERVGAWDIHLALFRQKTVLLFFFGIFSYVGIEQGISNWISEFLRTYHGLRPETQGAASVGLFWGMMTLGCFIGLILLKLFDGKVILRVFTVAAIITLSVALFGSAKLALFAFPAMGFCISVMYGIIFALGLNSVPKYHGSFSGILCSAIAGGAIFTLVIGKLKDLIGLQAGMLIILIPLAYILILSFRAKPIISNATIQRKKQPK
jgi:fucose permease